MGGSGSGNWWNHSSRPTCEGQKRIDLRYMRHRKMLRVGSSGTLSWSMGDEPMGRIGYAVHADCLELNYRVQGAGEEWKTIHERVRFAATPQHLGGERTWFTCPKCWRRCAVLYGGTYFRCRRCYRLGYQSQHESPMWRALSQAQKLRQKYGGSGSMDDLFPAKPKGMHWRTYHRLCRKAERLEVKIGTLEDAYFGNLMRRFHV